ncbi:hypothetical protein DL98DRAFT_565557 [Cadophora sp. DSE1049]|nr:hypothetical protein DL98DRAFT_565557 [Cadophora sp. DSE1049]
MQINDIIPGLGMPTMMNHVPSSASPKSPQTSKTTASTMSFLKSTLFWAEIAVALSLIYIVLKTAFYYAVNIWSQNNSMANFDNTLVCMWMILTSVWIVRIPIDEAMEESEKKNKVAEKASKSKTPLAPIPGKTKAKGKPKPSWDSNANVAWSCENWEELAMEAGHKERAQAQGKAETTKSERKTNVQSKKQRVAHLYVAARMLSDVVESLEKEVDRQEKQAEEIKKRMEMAEEEVCDDPTLEEDEDENEDGNTEAQLFKCCAGYWCRRNCCFYKRKLSVSPNADDQHEAEDEEYVKVTADVQL